LVLDFAYSDRKVRNDRENTRDTSTNEQMRANQDNMKDLISVMKDMIKVNTILTA